MSSYETMLKCFEDYFNSRFFSWFWVIVHNLNFLVWGVFLFHVIKQASMFLTIRHKTYDISATAAISVTELQEVWEFEVNICVSFDIVKTVLWYLVWVHMPSRRPTTILHCSLCSNCCHHNLQDPFCRALLNFEVPVCLFLQSVSVPLMFPEVVNEDAEQCWPHCQPLRHTSSDCLQMAFMPLITTLLEWQFNQFWTQPSCYSVCLWGCYGPKAC